MEDYHRGNIHTYILNCGVLDMGKFRQTIQVQAIGEEKFGEYATVSAYAFSVSVNISEENFSE